jgi:hypothetical protein
MSFGFSLAAIHCPECERLIVLSGAMTEPEYYTKKCEGCGALIEIRKNPATGKLEYGIAKPS